MKIFATRLKELRTERKLSLEKLGNIIGVTDTAIINWEKNRSEASGMNIKQLAIYFQVSADYLLGLEDETGAKTYPKYNIGTINNNGKMEIK